MGDLWGVFTVKKKEIKKKKNISRGKCIYCHPGIFGQ